MAQYNITVQAAVYCYLNNTTPICPRGQHKKFTWYSKGFAYCGTRKNCQCHNEESLVKAQQTNLEKFGETSYAKTAEYHEKAAATNLKKFGVEKASHNPAIRQKAKDTCLARYGTEHPSQLAYIREQAKKTKQERYGDPNFSNIEKRIATLEEKYGVTNASYINVDSGVLAVLHDKSAFEQFIRGKSQQLASKELNVDPNTIRKYAREYNCFDLFLVDSSQWEERVKQLLISLGTRFIQNDRSIISPFELDFYLPELKLAIEVNGNYWHCEDRKGKDYHFLKWQQCQAQGVDLYQFFEDEFIEKWPIIESKIRYLCGKKKSKSVGARLIQIRPVSAQMEREFLERNHIQGFSASRTRSYGAWYNDTLVGVMTCFTRSKYLEITRYATNIDGNYPGLFSKMLAHLVKDLSFVGKIVSFSNNSHSNGNVYRAAGFTQTAVLGPAYWYLSNGYLTRENRQKYMKEKIKKRFGVDIRNKTEKELMEGLGFKRIWDSGKKKWELHIGENNGTPL